ncbi:hypothetical protein MSG37_02005 [Shewanella sp. 1CM18E]|uniref:hypothetical protein n=1 Tax=Shewanella sp. 1CM18E TaxID=2929169 RepID=UPI0020BFCDDF|nr:hypothetical protein [Shewanella sp. 1CM18E]MCK8043645.1 hypothetical protein [Shewanella sp. 1CM18E]
MWEALEFSLSFLHRNSASVGGGHKKENKKYSMDFVHGIKTKGEGVECQSKLGLIEFFALKSAPEGALCV